MTDDGQHIEPFIPLRLLHLSEEKKSPQKKNKTLLLGAWHTRSLHSLNGAPDRRPSKSAVESKRVVKEKSGSKVSEKGKVEEEEEEGARLFFGGIWQLSSSVVFFFFFNRSTTTPSTQRLLLSLLPSPFVPHPAFPLG